MVDLDKKLMVVVMIIDDNGGVYHFDRSWS
jgi:hypothetical protein